MNLYEKLAKDAFYLLNLNPGDCGDCKYFKETEDAFGTGDSPPETECHAGCFSDCPRQDEIDYLITEDIEVKLTDISEGNLIEIMEAIKTNKHENVGVALINYLEN